MSDNATVAVIVVSFCLLLGITGLYAPELYIDEPQQCECGEPIKVREDDREGPPKEEA